MSLKSQKSKIEGIEKSDYFSIVQTWKTDSTHSDAVGGGMYLFPLIYKRNAEEEEEAEEFNSSY